MKLTRNMILSVATKRGGFNWHQLQLLGVGWPPKHGWLRKLVGQEINPATWEMVGRLRNKPKAHRVKILRGLGMSSSDFRNLCIPSKANQPSELIANVSAEEYNENIANLL